MSGWGLLSLLDQEHSVMVLEELKRILYWPIGVIKAYNRSKKRKAYPEEPVRVFLLNIPSHGNLGDHLISVVEQDFLKEICPEKRVLLVTSADLYFSWRIALAFVRKEDILCITGGGFMGSLYGDEGRILAIIRKYRYNKIIFFPQSFYYEKTPSGLKKTAKAARTLSMHKNLFVMTRDKTSYELVRNVLMRMAKERVFLVPDITLYAHYPLDRHREGVLWCVRNDAESLMKNEVLIETISKNLSSSCLNQRSTDTYSPYPIPEEEERNKVFAKLTEFASTQLVITDRLHGMILSAITDTPVIALDNISKKISQTYTLWLSNNPFIQFCDDPSSMAEVIDSLLHQKNNQFDNKALWTYYQPLINAINN